MKLKYRILWFEDDAEVIDETHGPDVRRLLTSLGLIPLIDHEENGSKLPELIRSKKINDYNLIISDLNLGEDNETGRELITHIREQRVFTEVLLYSASDAQMDKVIRSSGWVERASFCVGISPLREKLREVIRLTLNKQQDVNNTRGLFIAETILLEKKIERVILAYFKETEGISLSDEKIDLLNKIRDKRIKGNQKHIKLLEELEKIDLEHLLKKGIITASHTSEALQSILNVRSKTIAKKISDKATSVTEKGALEEQRIHTESLIEELKLFQEEIIAIRNTLAHVEELNDDKGVPYLASRQENGKTIVFDENQYTQMRLNLHRHSNNLDRIIQHIAE